MSTNYPELPDEQLQTAVKDCLSSPYVSDWVKQIIFELHRRWAWYAQRYQEEEQKEELK